MAKKQKSKQPFYFSLRDPLFKGSFFVIFGDLDYFKSVVSKKFKGASVDDITDSFVGMNVRVGDGICEENIIWFNDYKEWFFSSSKIESVVTIAHEALHAIIDNLQYRGLSLADQSEEAFTYYHSWLMTEILKRLEKRK